MCGCQGAGTAPARSPASAQTTPVSPWSSQHAPSASGPLGLNGIAPGLRSVTLRSTAAGSAASASNPWSAMARANPVIAKALPSFTKGAASFGAGNFGSAMGSFATGLGTAFGGKSGAARAFGIGANAFAAGAEASASWGAAMGGITGERTRSGKKNTGTGAKVGALVGGGAAALACLAAGPFYPICAAIAVPIGSAIGGAAGDAIENAT